MGEDQELLKRFDLPSDFDLIGSDPESLADPSNIVVRITASKWPIHYPHFAYCLPDEREIHQRFFSLRKVFVKKVETLLSREAESLGAHAKFPQGLVVAATLDVLQLLTTVEREVILQDSFSSFGFTASISTFSSGDNFKTHRKWHRKGRRANIE